MKCNCFECPLGKKSYEHYLRICEELDEEPYYEEAVYDIWCNKTGSKCGWYGFCDEAFEENIIHKKTNKKNSTKRTRREKFLRRLQHLERISNYPSPAMYIEEKWDKELSKYILVEKPYYKRCYRGNHKGSRYKFYKQYANKKVRRYGNGVIEPVDWDGDSDYWDYIFYPYNKHDGELKNGGSYKKVFDYWWTVD